MVPYEVEAKPERDTKTYYYSFVSYGEPVLAKLYIIYQKYLVTSIFISRFIQNFANIIVIVESCHNETNEIAECFAQDARYIVVCCHLKSSNLSATTSAINRKFAYLAAALVLIKLPRFLWRSDCSILSSIDFVSTENSICHRQTIWSTAFPSFRFPRIFGR